MEYEESITRGSGFKQLFGQFLLVVEVFRPIDMAAIVLIFKAAVNKHGLVVEMAVVAVEDANDSVVIDSRQASRLVHGNKMRQLQFVSVINIHNRLQATGAAILSVLLYHIARMLEHA